MKLSKIAVACGALCASQAFALAPPTGANPADLEVFISGASAQQKTLGSLVQGMMVPGTIDVYYNAGSKPGNDYRAYYGVMNGGDLDGLKVLIHNRAKGGSVFGVNPVARATAIDRMKVGTNCTTVGAVAPATYLCDVVTAGNLVSAVPDAGVSDVEPKMFTGINVAAGDDALTEAERGVLTPSSQLAVVFGVAVTDNVPSTVGLTKSEVNSMLTGTLKNWSRISGAVAGPVTVCRRKNGSGTQATFNAFFEQYACASNGGQLPSTAQISATYEVIESGSSGDVQACMETAYLAGKKAIGVLSLENVPVAGTNHYHFAKLDGTDATVLNATLGKYDFYSEQSFQWRNDVVNGIDAPSGNTEIFLNEFLLRSGDPAVLSVLPGVAALPTNFSPLAYPAGQVMKGSRQGDTCNSTQMFF